MELLLILILALIVFGPDKLPEVMGQIGKAINDFRRTSRELSDEFQRTLQAELEETKATVKGLQAELQETRAVFEGTDTPTPPAPRLAATPPVVETATYVNGAADPPPPAETPETWAWETASSEPAPSEPVAAEPVAAEVGPTAVLEASVSADDGRVVPAPADGHPSPVEERVPAPSVDRTAPARDDLLPPY